MRLDIKNTTKSLEILENHKNQFLQYLSTRNFMENSNPRTPESIYIEKPLKIIKQRRQNGGSPEPLYTPF